MAFIIKKMLEKDLVKEQIRDGYIEKMREIKTMINDQLKKDIIRLVQVCNHKGPQHDYQEVES